MRKLLPVVVAAVALLAACSDVGGAPLAGGTVVIPSRDPEPEVKPSEAPKPVTAATERGRQSPGVVAAGIEAPYNYGPTLLAENGKIRMWWCSQVLAAMPAGDDILYAESTSAAGPFSAATPVVAGSFTGFDGEHTCDPSVIKVGPTYYMYYTGAAGAHANGNAIGVATSADGIVWARANGGMPIVGPSYDVSRANSYGAGQPAVVHVDGWFYVMFTDTTGRAAVDNGAGQFVLRSKDPLFGSGIETLTYVGFIPVEATNKSRTRSVVEAFSADLMWVAAANTFVIAHETEQGTTLTTWDKDFTRQPLKPVTIPGPWQEGPGLVRTPQGHAQISPENPCDRLPVDLVRATVIGWANAPTELRHFGLDLTGVPGCTTGQEAEVLNGFAVPSPDRTIDIIIGGDLVRVERRSVAEKLAKAVLTARPSYLDRMKVVARVPAGARAVRSPDGKVGLLLDGDKLWLIGSADLARLNSSDIVDVPKDKWDDYERGSDLTSLR